jgi:hypothetical protein
MAFLIFINPLVLKSVFLYIFIMKKVYLIVFLFLWVCSSWAQIREFQTTRLNSTAGAGVASVLSTEAAVLNPATAAFFEGSSFSYQRYTTSLRHESDDRVNQNDDFPGGNVSQGYFMADHSGPLKGGLSYLKQQENNYHRKQLVLHGAAPIGAATAFGVSYRYQEDNLAPKHGQRHHVNHQLYLGTVHIIDENTILGLTLIDPTRTTPGEERALFGFQYALASRVTLIADVGAQYSKAFNKQYLWRGAAQISLFDDFFLRAGRFYDNVRLLKGYGWGVGWLGPRLGIEFAQRYSDQFGRENSYVYYQESLVDTALSAIIKF